MTKIDEFPKAFFLTMVVPFWGLIKNPFGSRALAWVMFVPHCILCFNLGWMTWRAADTYGVPGARERGIVAGRKVTSGGKYHDKYELKVLLFGKEEWVRVSPVEHAYETGTFVEVDYTPGRFSGEAYINSVDKVFKK